MIPVNLFFHGLWMLCGVGAVVFAATAAPAWLQQLAVTLGFALAVFFTGPDRLPDPVSVGGLAAFVAAWQLWRPAATILPLASAGALAGLWSSLLRVQGLPWPLAVVGAAAVPLASSFLTRRRPKFAPEMLREEAQLVVLVLSLAVVLAPGIIDGWQSAVALNVGLKEDAGPDVPVWTWCAVSGTTALGGLYSLWMRR